MSPLKAAFIARPLVSSLVLTLVVMTVGCQTTVTTSDGRPAPPKPRAAPPVPRGAEANAMAMRVGLKATDTNGNGFPDLIPVEVYLFARPHATPLQQPGDFEFALYKAGQSFGESDPMASWRFEGEYQQASRFQSPMFGPGYAFGLSLLEAGGDDYALMPANLVCWFHPAGGGEPVKSTGSHTIQIGAGR